MHRLDGATYRTIATHVGDTTVRVEPFDVVALELAPLWSRR